MGRDGVSADERERERRLCLHTPLEQSKLASCSVAVYMQRDALRPSERQTDRRERERDREVCVWFRSLVEFNVNTIHHCYIAQALHLHGHVRFSKNCLIYISVIYKKLCTLLFYFFIHFLVKNPFFLLFFSLQPRTIEIYHNYNLEIL